MLTYRNHIWSIMNQFASLREEFTKGSLKRDDLMPNPLDQFGIWMQQAIESRCLHPNAVSLGTVSEDGMPNVRIVLLKDFGDEGFVFYTNYDSQKGQELTHNPMACLNFFWGELERQVRINGRIIKTSSKDSDLYFQSRPRLSQLGAMASPQSNVLNNENVLEETYRELLIQFGDKPIMRPNHWGGYVLIPDKMEFWQGRANRLHDRFRYSKKDQKWKIERIAP